MTTATSKGYEQCEEKDAKKPALPDDTAVGPQRPPREPSVEGRPGSQGSEKKEHDRPDGHQERDQYEYYSYYSAQPSHRSPHMISLWNSTASTTPASAVMITAEAEMSKL